MMTFGSLFSGVGGFDLGFERAGMECAWQVEIDDACRGVLARHWPNVERHTDVRACGATNLQPVDVICGGYPCQDHSVAGKRKGLAGERSGLWFEYQRIIAELRPRWVVIENVPGQLSSTDGRDFALVIGGLTGIVPSIPEGGWGTAGFFRGRVYNVAYRICDSQYWGVAQRRRRVFVVGSLGDGRCAEVLFERDGSAWDSPPRREAGQGVADQITRSFAKHRGASAGKDCYPRNTIVNCFNGYTGGADDNDAQGKHLVASAISASAGHHGHSSPRGDGSDNLIAFQCHGNNVGPIGTLRDGNGGVTGGVPMVFESRLARNGRGAPSPVVPPLKAQSGQSGKGDAAPMVMGYTIHGTDKTARVASETDVAGNIRTKPPGSQENSSTTVAVSAFGVRRLTPTECERLQGFPDGWTEYAVIGNPLLTALGVESEKKLRPQADSARYRQMGNAVTVSVAGWIGKRIVEVSE